MEFVLIAPKTFTTGKNAGSKLTDIGGLDYDNATAHKVTLTKAFYIQNNPVSEQAYKQSGLPGSADDASWNDAAGFCAWLSKREGRKYRLPTEAEWECVFQAMPAGRKMENREWVQDWHGVLPPDDVTDPIGPETGMTKVIRDGPKRESLSPDAKNSPGAFLPRDSELFSRPKLRRIHSRARPYSPRRQSSRALNLHCKGRTRRFLISRCVSRCRFRLRTMCN